jgi:SRSO17 transposase
VFGQRRVPKITYTQQTNKQTNFYLRLAFVVTGCLLWVRETRMGEIDKLGWLAWFVTRVTCAVSSPSLVSILSV